MTLPTVIKKAFLLMLISAFTACSTDNDFSIDDEIEKVTDDEIDMSLIDFSNIKNLYAQPLPVIQKCVQGKWKWIVRFSGIGGFVKIDFGLVEITENKIMGFNEIIDDNVILKKDVQEFIWKLSEYRGALGYVAWGTEYDGPICVFNSIQNDTMRVTGYYYRDNSFWFDVQDNLFIRINDDYK